MVVRWTNQAFQALLSFTKDQPFPHMTISILTTILVFKLHTNSGLSTYLSSYLHYRNQASGYLLQPFLLAFYRPSSFPEFPLSIHQHHSASFTRMMWSASKKAFVRPFAGPCIEHVLLEGMPTNL